jgi:hypothetical protein
MVSYGKLNAPGRQLDVHFTLSQMNKGLFPTTILIATVLLSGCLARYRDISSNPTQKALVGDVCEVVEPLRAHGVALKVERDEKTDLISIWNPGSKGPEITFIYLLQPGTKLKVLSARECVNCPFDHWVEYEVKVTPEPSQFAGKPAYIRAKSLALPYVRCPIVSPARSIAMTATAYASGKNRSTPLRGPAY